MIADTVKNRIATITTIHPIKAIGRLKIFRSGLAVDEGQRRQERHKRAGNGDGPEELAELTGEDLQPQHLEQEEKIPFRFRMVIAGIGRRLFQAARPAPKTPGRQILTNTTAMPTMSFQTCRGKK